ncbi:MAG: pyrroline-5-carboxylate reductase [Gammaproteobacteria bacterium]|nr:pyrroline-5-carboxylate reductase [Gammaproteobacteria bacterium]
MKSVNNILLVGCGNMGSALLRGWLTQGVDAQQLHVIDEQDGVLERALSFGVSASSSLSASVAQPDVIVFAVKPQQIDMLVPQFAELAERGAVVLSVAAGKSIGAIEKLLGGAPMVVRAMPNTPAAIGQGITALVANSAVGGEQKSLCERLLSAVGAVVWLDDEALMDAVTAISGSGPAYVFLLIEALAGAAEKEGLAADLAKTLATATVAGAGAYAAQSLTDPGRLREQVTSPGGTTQAALEILMGDDGLAELIAKAVQAAAARSRELG